MEQQALLARARQTFHARLIERGVLGYTVKKGEAVASNADVKRMCNGGGTGHARMRANHSRRYAHTNERHQPNRVSGAHSRFH